MRSPLSRRANADIAVVPAPGRLAEGVVVEGIVFVRLFGINLLRVKADVVLVPADVRRIDDGDRARAPQLPRVGPADADGHRREAHSVSLSTHKGQSTLKKAQQLLRDTDALLQHARRTP